MRLLLIFLIACGMTQRPIDILGRGTMCEAKTEYRQSCTNGSGKRFDCLDSSGRWTCTEVK